MCAQKKENTHIEKKKSTRDTPNKKKVENKAVRVCINKQR